MIGYVMVGTRDMPAATAFYDTVLAPLGLVRDVADESYAAYGPTDSPQNIEFYVTKPIDGQPATSGNGTMVALAASSRELVDEFHATGIASGGTDEGKPGFRPADGNVYYAYVRDLDGNKICAFTTEK